MCKNEHQHNIPVESIGFLRSHKNRKDLTYIATGADSTVYKWSRPNQSDKVVKYYYHHGKTNGTDLRIYTDLLNKCSKKIQEKPLDSPIGPIHFVIVPVETVTSVVLPDHGECAVSVSPFIDGFRVQQFADKNWDWSNIVSGYTDHVVKNNMLNFVKNWGNESFKNIVFERLSKLNQTLKKVCGSQNAGCDEINTKLSYQKNQGYRFNLTDIALSVTLLVADKKFAQKYYH